MGFIKVLSQRRWWYIYEYHYKIQKCNWYILWTVFIALILWKPKKKCLQDFTGALKPVISLSQSTQPLPYGKIEQQKKKKGPDRAQRAAWSKNLKWIHNLGWNAEDIMVITFLSTITYFWFGSSFKICISWILLNAFRINEYVIRMSKCMSSSPVK